MRKRTYTRRAFLCLMIPVFHLAVTIMFSVLAGITEFPTNRGNIYLVFAVIATGLMILLPLVSSVCSIVSIVYQVGALRNQEDKLKNVVMMIISFIYLVITVALTCLFWQGAMSV